MWLKIAIAFVENQIVLSRSLESQQENLSFIFPIKTVQREGNQTFRIFHIVPAVIFNLGQSIDIDHTRVFIIP
jgi:hypothetical protein